MELTPDSRIPEGADNVADLLMLANQGNLDALKRLGIETIVRAVIELRSEKKFPEVHWPAQTNDLTGYLQDAVYMATIAGEKSPIEEHPWTVPLVRFFKTIGFSHKEVVANLAEMNIAPGIRNAFNIALARARGDEQW